MAARNRREVKSKIKGASSQVAPGVNKCAFRTSSKRAEFMWQNGIISS